MGGARNEQTVDLFHASRRSGDMCVGAERRVHFIPKPEVDRLLIGAFHRTDCWIFCIEPHTADITIVEIQRRSVDNHEFTIELLEKGMARDR